MFILRHGVRICLQELFNINTNYIFPEQRLIFSFHEYLYEPYFLKPSRMALERGAIQQHSGPHPRDLREYALASLFQK
jgi:hypothetical protein